MNCLKISLFVRSQYYVLYNSTINDIVTVASLLLGHKEDNPLPETTSDSALAEDFASFFHDKINNIRTRFKDIQPYKPDEKCNVPLL